ncbi:Mpo1 protein [Pichia kluyveri]|uniref:Mpo1 protein n=1 Tax=Pichia kluyveri TaxID=36015 RepID=A0AAV5R305_PICKL|nr:Mpo1 protein [Pichia kluyveri]
MALTLKEQLSFYKKYHRNTTNVLIHIICIPQILFSSLVLASNYSTNLSRIVMIGYSIFYIKMHLTMGIIGTIFLFLMEIGAEKSGVSNKNAILMHIFSWIAQFYGHGIHEHRSPAVLSHPLQPLVLAPYFVLWEIAFAMGFYKDIEKSIS